MIRTVTATFTVTMRAIWSIDPSNPLTVKDDEGRVVATFARSADACSAVSDHNRTGRQRAKARERAKQQS